MVFPSTWAMTINSTGGLPPSRSPFRSLGERAGHEGHEPVLLVGLGGAHPLEVVAQADVGVHARRVLVEVQEGLLPAVEDAPVAFDQAWYGPESDQQRLDAVERLGRRVPHRCTVAPAR